MPSYWTIDPARLTGVLIFVSRDEVVMYSSLSAERTEQLGLAGVVVVPSISSARTDRHIAGERMTSFHEIRFVLTNVQMSL